MLYIAKNGPMNLILVNRPEDVDLFPERVRAAIRVLKHGLSVDSREYADGEMIPWGSYIAWETADHPNCPAGWNLWNKSNTAEQLAEGTIREANGKFFHTRAVPREAELFTGDFPEILRDQPTFEGQFRVSSDILYVDTPWGEASGQAYHSFVVIYGICNGKAPDKYIGSVDANILTVGTPSFEAYWVVDPDGNIIESLSEYYQRMV